MPKNPTTGTVTMKERQVEYAIADHIKDEAKAKEVFELVKNQPEYK